MERGFHGGTRVQAISSNMVVVDWTDGDGKVARGLVTGRCIDVKGIGGRECYCREHAGLKDGGAACNEADELKGEKRIVAIECCDFAFVHGPRSCLAPLCMSVLFPRGASSLGPVS